MEWKEIENELDKIYSGVNFGAEIEGQFIDFKRCPDKIKGVIHFCRKMAVCFANAHGGTLILGVEDRIKGPSAFSGCQDFNIWDISKGVREGTKQPVNVDVSYHNYRGKNLIEIKIPKGPYEGAHALTDGSQSTRRGADCQPLFPEAKSPKFVQAEALDYSRSIVDGLTIDDLDSNELKRLRDVITFNESFSDFLRLNDEDLLKSLGMIQEDTRGNLKITAAALLFLGKSNLISNNIPQSELVFLAFGKNDREANEERFTGGLLSIVLDFQEYYNTNYNKVNHLDTGLFEIKIPKIPDAVLREALLNALTHREYQIQTSIFFKDYSDRIELTNPGEFIGDITPDNILYHSPIWRNRLIAEIFQKIGLVRRSGLGIDRMYQNLLNVGKEPPQFIEQSSEITLIISDYIDENFAKYLSSLEQKGESLPLDEMIVLSKLRSQDKLKIKEVANVIQRAEGRAKILLNRMFRERKIERYGSGTGTYYRLSAKLYNQLGDALGYYRNGHLEKSKYKEMIMKALHDRKRITNQDVQNLTSLDRDHAYLLLRELETENKVQLHGSGRGSHYKIVDDD